MKTGEPPDGAPEAAGPGVARARPEAPAAAVRIDLPVFEGPLDLLLHLIQKHELDILDIPIAFVTEKFVEYVTLLHEMNIDVASEYLVMAATLAHIKSRMLLPAPPPEPGEQVEEEDPRAELVRRLLEYQKYKLAAEQLGGRDVLGRDVFGRGTAEAVAEGPAPLAQLGIFKLMDALESVLKRVRETKAHVIDFERISIADRIHQLTELLGRRPSLVFDELFEGARTRMDVILTFLALLEMTKLRMTRIRQESTFGAIHVELAVQDDRAPGAAEPGPPATAPEEPSAPSAEPAADPPDEGAPPPGPTEP